MSLRAPVSGNYPSNGGGVTCLFCITSMKFMSILLEIDAPCDLSGDVRSRRFPPFRLRRRRESSTLCTQGPARGPFFVSLHALSLSSQALSAHSYFRA